MLRWCRQRYFLPHPCQGFYGKEANYNINPMSFNKLDANGNALPDSASSWAMVRDNVTGLIWELKRNKDVVKNYNDSRDADNTYTWYDPSDPHNVGTPGDGTDTNDFIDGLNSSNFGGYNDWRLPTIKELTNLVDYSQAYPGPTINKQYFPNTDSLHNYRGYWSSTTDADSFFSLPLVVLVTLPIGTRVISCLCAQCVAQQHLMISQIMVMVRLLIP